MFGLARCSRVNKSNILPWELRNSDGGAGRAHNPPAVPLSAVSFSCRHVPCPPEFVRYGHWRAACYRQACAWKRISTTRPAAVVPVRGGLAAALSQPYPEPGQKPGRHHKQQCNHDRGHDIKDDKGRDLECHVSAYKIAKPASSRWPNAARALTRVVSMVVLKESPAIA